MLRRIAGDLFWTARYLERAQWRTRLVDVNYRLLLEGPPREADPWEPLVRIMGEMEPFGAKYSKADEASVIAFFTFDRDSPSSIRKCIEWARADLGPLRHLISSELWLELNRLYLDSLSWSAQSLAARGMNSFFTELRDRFYTLIGIISSTLPRDELYDFMQIGTMIERIDNLARLLDVKYHYLLPRVEDVGGAIDLRQWTAVLRSASALEAFRRNYGNAMQIDRVVEILLFDRTFPRSVRFSSDRITESLSRIADDGEDEEVARAAQALSADLHDASPSKIISGGLHDFMLGLQDHSAAIAQAVFDRFMALG